MSSDVAEPLPPQEWEPLSLIERRILGTLVEKQKTSKNSDTYPLSLNSLTTGCNQKSNRDPVLDLSEDEVEQVLEDLQKKNLVTRLTGGRVDRFKHELYEKWTRNGPQMAVLAELLLRGPQTKGELRVRASRMDAIDTQEALEEVLKPMVERRLVFYLTEPERRGALVTHGFHSPEDLARLKSRPAAIGESPPPRMSPDFDQRLQHAEAEIAKLKETMSALEAKLAQLM